jgi:alkylated DNA repair dioxygenase AlkB
MERSASADHATGPHGVSHRPTDPASSPTPRAAPTPEAAPTLAAAAGRAEIALGALAAQRTWVDEASWVDVVPGWVRGADALFDLVVERVPIAQTRVYRYDHWVDEPHAGGSFGPASAPHEVLVEAQRRMQHHYGVRFGGAGVVLYRDGRDGMAFHRDRDMRWLDDTVVALLVLGDRRPFHLRPRADRYAHEAAHKGASHAFDAGRGDLLVLGGAIQVGWEHSVPQQRGSAVGPRLSVQWRWTSKRGRQERGGSYRKPLHYGR